jgi:hypothetical protein
LPGGEGRVAPATEPERERGLGRRRLGTDAAGLVCVLLFAASPARAEPVPKEVDIEIVQAPSRELGPCVSEDERRAAQPGERWKAFRRSAVPLPPLLYLSQDRTFAEALLLYWKSTDVEAGTKLHLLVPLVLKSCTPRSRTLVTPLFGQRVDAVGRAGFVGPYFFRRDSQAQSDVLFPLFARLVEPGRRTVAVLNVYSRTTPEGSSGGVVPLVFWGRSRDGSHHTLLPPLVYDWGDRESRTTVAASFYLRTHRSGGFDAGLVPLYFGARHADRYADVVPPLLFARWGDRSERRLWWLTSYFGRDPGGWRFGFLPFYLGGETHGRSHHVVPPLLFGTWANAGAGTRTVWWLTGGFHRDPGGWSAALAPVFFAGRRGPRHHTAILPPLFVHWAGDTHERTLMLNAAYERERATGSYGFTWFPLLWIGRSGARSHFVSPLFARWTDGERSTTVVPPAYYHRNATGRHFGLVPLYFQGGGGARRYVYVPPLFTFDWSDEARGERTTVVPLAYRHRVPGGWDLGVIPFYFGRRRGSQHLAIVPPALAVHWGDGRAEKTLALGVGYYFRSPDARHAGLFPLWMGGSYGLRQPGGPARYDLVLPPLFIRHRHERATTTWVLQSFVHFPRDGGWHAGSIPFYVGGRTERGEFYDLVLPPLVARFGDDTVSFLFAGPVYRFRRDVRRYFGVLPLYYGGRALAIDQRRAYDHVLPPLFMYWRGPDDSNLVCGPFYRMTEPRRARYGLFPFYYGGRRQFEHTATYYDHVLPPLFMRWGSSEEHNLVVGPFYRLTGPRSSRFGLFPIYLGGREKSAARTSSYDHVLPPLFMRWGDGSRRTTAVLSAFYHRGPGGYDVGLFPIFFHGARAREGTSYTHVPPLLWHVGAPRSSTTLLLPLFLHSRNGDRHLFVSPLVIEHRDPAAHARSLVVFPLLWHFAGPDGTVNVGFPLWWDFHQARRGTRTSVLFPFGFRRVTRDETTVMVLNTLVTRGKGRFAAAWSFHFVPLVDLARYNPRHFKWQLLLGLLGHESEGPLGRWRIFYVWTEPS